MSRVDADWAKVPESVRAGNFYDRGFAVRAWGLSMFLCGIAARAARSYSTCARRTTADKCTAARAVGKEPLVRRKHGIRRAEKVVATTRPAMLRTALACAHRRHR